MCLPLVGGFGDRWFTPMAQVRRWIGVRRCCRPDADDRSTGRPVARGLVRALVPNWVPTTDAGIPAKSLRRTLEPRASGGLRRGAGEEIVGLDDEWNPLK
jgi:hypothetical protein